MRASAPPTICPICWTGCSRQHRRADVSANGFASAMTRAFTQATVGGKQFDDVLKSLALRISSMALTQAFKPIATASPIAQRRADATVRRAVRRRRAGRASRMGAIKPFAAGGVIGAPSYFPLVERRAGPRRRSGAGGDRAADARRRRAARRRHERRRRARQCHRADRDAGCRQLPPLGGLLTGQIARAVARGQRELCDT